MFYVPGIEFSLAVGAAVDNVGRENCFACNPAHPIIVDFSADLQAIIKRVWANARKAKNVGKYLKNG